MGAHQSLAPCSVKCQLMTYLHQLEIQVQKYANKYVEEQICQLRHWDVESVLLM